MKSEALACSGTRAARGALCALCLLGVGACDDTERESAAPAASASAGPLPPELAEKALVKIGTRTITLGQYRAALERMDQFERLRYQGADRRKQLLEEMINLELLAQEARRRGLDQKPETRQHLRQMLRDEMLEEARRKVPKPEELPESDVRAYFDAHKSDFAEPERRRVAHIAIASREDASKVLELARNASPDEWGRLVAKHSLDRPEDPEANTALELAGDLGIVGPLEHPRGANPRVPDALRAAVFRIDRVGGVYPEWVEAGGHYHIVRMTGKTEARQRTFVDAERTVRVALVQQLIREAEARFEAELRERFPVTIDEEALSAVKVPKLAAQPNPAASDPAPVQPAPSRAAPSASEKPHAPETPGKP